MTSTFEKLTFSPDQLLNFDECIKHLTPLQQKQMQSKNFTTEAIYLPLFNYYKEKTSKQKAAKAAAKRSQTSINNESSKKHKVDISPLPIEDITLDSPEILKTSPPSTKPEKIQIISPLPIEDITLNSPEILKTSPSSSEPEKIQIISLPFIDPEILKIPLPSPCTKTNKDLQGAWSEFCPPQFISNQNSFSLRMCDIDLLFYNFQGEIKHLKEQQRETTHKLTTLFQHNAELLKQNKILTNSLLTSVSTLKGWAEAAVTKTSTTTSTKKINKPIDDHILTQIGEVYKDVTENYC
jgi:hypothetical protein